MTKYILTIEDKEGGGVTTNLTSDSEDVAAAYAVTPAGKITDKVSTFLYNFFVENGLTNNIQLIKDEAVKEYILEQEASQSREQVQEVMSESLHGRY